MPYRDSVPKHIRSIAAVVDQHNVTGLAGLSIERTDQRQYVAVGTDRTHDTESEAVRHWHPISPVRCIDQEASEDHLVLEVASSAARMAVVDVVRAIAERIAAV